MSFQGEVNQILSRKVISSAISGSLFAIFLGLFVPNPFGQDIRSMGEYFQLFLLSVPVYLMYSFPVILLYGTITSTLSDYIARLISKYTSERFKIYFSIILHILFGFVLLWYGLLASCLYFITDYILSKKAIYKWNKALKSLGIPILVWILFMGGIYILELFR